jgi:hypothetical protein
MPYGSPCRQEFYLFLALVSQTVAMTSSTALVRVSMTEAGAALVAQILPLYVAMIVGDMCGLCRRLGWLGR